MSRTADDIRRRFKAFREQFLTDPPKRNAPTSAEREPVVWPGQILKYYNGRGYSREWVALVRTDPRAQPGDIVEAESAGFAYWKPADEIEIVKVVLTQPVMSTVVWAWQLLEPEKVAQDDGNHARHHQ